MSMKEMFLKESGLDKDGWTVDYAGVLICPHGHRVEDDGECPEGCKSPMLAFGII